MKTMKYDNQELKAYRINENGEVFYGKFNRKQNYFIYKGQYLMKLFINKQEIVVDYLDLILSNYKSKPKNGDHHAHLAVINFEKEYPFNVNNIIWKKSVVSFHAKKEKVPTENLKGMRFIFIDGIGVGMVASKSGQIFDLNGVEKKPQIDRRGRPFIEIHMPYGLGKSNRKLVDIIVESYLLPYKDDIRNYHFSYLDKNKKNCSTKNIIMWKEGSSGIAIKKTVRVLKEGKLFGIFDSVSVCAKILDIPRRTVSEMLKGMELKGFKAEEIKLF